MFSISNSGSRPSEKELGHHELFTFKCDRKTKSTVKKIFKSDNKNKEKIDVVLDVVHTFNGIEYATDKMQEHKSNALKMLEQIRPSEAKEHFIELINYTVDRKY